MKIQVNSDNTIAVDASLISFIEGEATRKLDRFAAKITRIEVHLSDVNNARTGPADKRCLVEVRPAGDRPRSASAIAAETESAVRQALGKMQRSLSTLFGRRGKAPAEISVPVARGKKAAATKTARSTKKKTAPKKTAIKKAAKLNPRGPKKKGIYRARRKSWPSR
jgi:hypothetical protein